MLLVVVGIPDKFLRNEITDTNQWLICVQKLKYDRTSFVSDITSFLPLKSAHSVP